MNLKRKLRIYRTVINEVSTKYETTREFMNKRLNELCSEHGISAEGVRLYIFIFLILHTQFSYEHSLATCAVQSGSFFFIKIVLF